MTERWLRVRGSPRGGDICDENPSVGKQTSKLMSRRCGSEPGQSEGQCKSWQAHSRETGAQDETRWAAQLHPPQAGCSSAVSIINHSCNSPSLTTRSPGASFLSPCYLIWRAKVSPVVFSFLKSSSPKTELPCRVSDLLLYPKLCSVTYLLRPVPLRIEEYQEKGGVLKPSRTFQGLPGYRSPLVSPISCL